MRILFFVHSLRRGGAERVLLEVALGLQKKGHIVEVLSWLRVDEYREERYRSITRHFTIPKEEYRWPWSIPRASALLGRYVGRFQPDVIEIHTPTVAWVAAWANSGIPCVQALHGYGSITRKDSIKDKAVRVLDRLTQRRLKTNFIVVSESMTKVAAAHFSLLPACFACVPNGVDLEKFKFTEKMPDRSSSILMLGTLCSNKGQTLGIRAFKAVLDTMPNVRLTIVGEGFDRPMLEALAKNNGLEGKVKFLGRRDDVPKILSQTHILWQLSESEGMPMVVLEAMAAGVPVIGFNVRGTRDAVANNETGYLVDHGDTESVKQATVELLRDESRYLNFSLNARYRAEEFFSFNGMLDGHERVLRSVTSVNGDE